MEWPEIYFSTAVPFVFQMQRHTEITKNRPPFHLLSIFPLYPTIIRGANRKEISSIRARQGLPSYLQKILEAPYLRTPHQHKPPRSLEDSRLHTISLSLHLQKKQRKEEPQSLKSSLPVHTCSSSIPNPHTHSPTLAVEYELPAYPYHISQHPPINSSSNPLPLSLQTYLTLPYHTINLPPSPQKDSRDPS